MANERKMPLNEPLPFGKGTRVMQARRYKGKQLTKEDLILVFLVAGMVLVALWIGIQIL